MINKSLEFVEGFAPPTIANVGSGFDVVGLAINAKNSSDVPLGDTVRISPILDNRYESIPNSGIVLKIIGRPEAEKLPLNPEKNSATVPLIFFRQEKSCTVPIEVILNKGLPLGSGLGSSAASSAAALVALNELYGFPYQKEELVRFALEGEFIACGARHADNVAPAILGGATITTDHEKGISTKIELSEDFIFVVVHPHVELNTEDSRRVLPDNYSKTDVVAHMANISGLVSGFFTNDVNLVASSLEDYIATPFRKKLIPHFEIASDEAMKSGALGYGISGSGPSMFFLCASRKSANKVVENLKVSYSKANISCDIYLTNVDNEGARTLSRG